MPADSAQRRCEIVRGDIDFHAAHFRASLASTTDAFDRCRIHRSLSGCISYSRYAPRHLLGPLQITTRGTFLVPYGQRFAQKVKKYLLLLDELSQAASVHTLTL